MRSASLALLTVVASLVAHCQTDKTVNTNHQLILAIQSRDTNRALKAIHTAKLVSFVDNGTTPLIEAIALDERTIAFALLDAGADPNATDGQGVSPLMAACWYGQEDVVNRLLSRGATINAADHDGSTPLIEAAGSVDTASGGRIVSLLLRKGAEVNVKSNYGETPLTTAAFYGNEEAVHSLVAAGANVAYVNEDGENAMDIACTREIGRTPSHDVICSFLRTHTTK
jgi:ankyrin repeat protein